MDRYSRLAWDAWWTPRVHDTEMEHAFQGVVVFVAALATGGLLVNWIGLGRTMTRLSVSTYIETHQATNRTFDPYMPIVVVSSG